MINNNQEKTSDTEPKQVDHKAQIDLIFSSEHPLNKLNQVAATVPHTLGYDYSLIIKKQLDDPLKKEEAMAELTYLALPQLNAVLMGMKDFGIEERELVGVGFQKVAEAIEAWKQEKDVLIPEQQDHLRSKVARDTRKRMQEYFTKEYNLNATRFELIPLYFEISHEFQEINGYVPKLENWQEIEKMVDDYAKSLPETKRGEFKKMRFIEEIFEDKRVTVDTFRTIYEQVCGQSPDNSIIDETEGAEEIRDKNLLRERMKEALSTLNDRERRLVELRYGFKDGKGHTFEDIGKTIGVTAERVRTIINNAEKKMRHPVVSRTLRPFVDSHPDKRNKIF